MNLRRFAAVVAVSATVLVPSTSNAQVTSSHAPFGARAQNVVAIDEMIGFYRETVSFPDNSNGDESGWLRVGSHDGIYALNESTRFGYHRFVTPEISLGTGFHYASRDVTAGYIVAAKYAGKVTTIGFSPRVGFVFHG